MTERIVDAAYLTRVRQLSCVACGRTGPCEAHHIGPRAKSRRAGDGNVAALCRSCHEAFHAHGRLLFSARVGINEDELVERTRVAHARRWPNVDLPPRDQRETIPAPVLQKGRGW